MIAETKPAPPPPIRDTHDRDSYAYAAGSSSFIAVLAAINRAQDARPSAPQPIESRETPPTEKEADKTADPAGTSNSRPEASEEAGEVDRTHTDAGTTSDSTDPEPDGEFFGDAEDLASIPASADGAAEDGPGEALPISGAASAPVDTDARPATPPVDTAPALAAAPVNTAKPAAPLSGVAAASPTDSGADGDPGPAILDGAEPEAGTGKLNPPPFPKTLNALLAENAVKLRETEASAARPATGSPVEVAADLDAEPKVVPEEKSAPLPQSGATELGGVRAATAPVLPRVPLVNLPGEIVQQLHLIGRTGTSTMRLHLVPEHLGELHLEIHRTGDTVRVTMISPNPHIRDALDSQMAELRKALEQQGLTLAEASVADHPAPKENGGHEKQGPQRGSAISTPPAGGKDPVATGPEALANGTPGGLNVLA